MAEILKFKRSERWYIEQSEYWSKRGDSFKSLLYARQACECGGISARLRLAAALYETGNYTRAAEVYIKFLGEGHSTAEIYAGLIKCLADMSRFRSAAFFIREAKALGLIPKLRDKIACRADFNKALAEIKKQFPNLKREFDSEEDAEFKRLLYVIRRGDFNLDETLLPDLYLCESDNAASEILFKAASIITPDKLNAQLSTKLLAACDEGMKGSDFPRQDIIATKIVSLVSLGRLEEAEIAAEDLMSLELPDNDVDLLKCAIAMMVIEYHDGAVDYLEELTNDVFEENLVYLNAIANLNAGDKDRAKELFSEVLVINPHNVGAKYYCDLLIRSDTVSDYDMYLPDEVETEVRVKIENMFETAREAGGKMSEHRDMRELLAYELRSADPDYASYVGNSLAVLGIYRGVLRDYLLDAECRLTVKREIIANMLSVDYKTPVTAYLFGIKRICVMRDFYGLGTSDGLIRAYVSALAAFAVFGSGDGSLEEVFDKAYPYLSALSINTIADAENVAAALALYGGLADAGSPKEAASLFGAAETREVSRICDALEFHCNDLRRPKRSSQKRRKP